MTRPTIPPRHSASAEAARRFQQERDAKLTPEQREAQERELRQACEELARMRDRMGGEHG